MVHLTAGLCYVKEDLVLLVFYLFSFLDEELITLSKHEIVFFPPLFIFVGLLFLHRPQTGGESLIITHTRQASHFATSLVSLAAAFLSSTSVIASDDILWLKLDSSREHACR